MSVVTAGELGSGVLPPPRSTLSASLMAAVIAEISAVLILIACFRGAEVFFTGEESGVIAANVLSS